MKQLPFLLLAVLAVSAFAGAELQPRDLTPVTTLTLPKHPPVEIVRDGEARAVVQVADAQPSAALERLVTELVEVIALSSGATLERTAQRPAAEQPAIVIGDCDEARLAS